MYNTVATFMSDNFSTDASSLILLYSNRKTTHPTSIIMHRYTLVRICLWLDRELQAMHVNCFGCLAWLYLCSESD